MKLENYVVQLDGLRFFAIFSVMIAHWAQWNFTNTIVSAIPFVHGVILFFVLSGFLISNILIRNRVLYDAQKARKKELYKAFYIRRIIRIFPIYYLLLIGLYWIDFEQTRTLAPWLFTYTSNIYQSIHNVYIGSFNHFWSLAVEEQFYLIWPLFMLLIPQKHLGKAIIFTILLSLGIKVYIFNSRLGWMANAYFTLSCMHALGLGALLAWMLNYRSDWFKNCGSAILVWSGLVLYAFFVVVYSVFEISWMKEVVDEFVFAAVAMCIIARAATNGFKFMGKYILEHPFVVYSGKVSYGLYVFHLFIPALYYYLMSRLGVTVDNKYMAFGLMYLLCLGIAHLSWRLIESPINNMKRFFPYYKKLND